MDTDEERGLNLKLFQEELTEIAQKGKNTIVCSETGTGKTRIAFAIIKDHLKKNPKGRVGILANNTLLVEQHYKTLLSLLPEFEDSSIRLTGDNKHSKNLHLFVKNIPIIILTPQLIINAIEKGRDPNILSRFTLLVFDECHHTYGDHVFNKVMRQYHMDRDQGNKIPQILGLTATLGTGSADSTEKAKSHILKIMANLDVEELSTVIREKDNYQSFLKDVKTEIIQLKKSKTKDPVGEVLQNVMEMLEEKVYSLKGHLSSDDREEDEVLNLINGAPGPEKRNSTTMYITWCRRLYDSAIHLMGKNLELANEIKLYAEYLQIFCESLDINNCIRGENSIQALMKKLKQENFHLSSQNQCEDELAKLAEDSKKRMEERVPFQPKNRHIDTLLAHLKQHLREDSTVIIFVMTRELAYHLTMFLKKEGYNFERLTGHSAGDGEKATSQNEQKNIKDKLDACKIQGIVATDIAGEGLDLQKCSCVIRYKCAGNAISSIQMKGRVRSDNGTCITLGDRHHSIREELNMWMILRMIEAKNEIVVKMNKKELKETLDNLRKEIVLQEKRRQILEKENNLKKEECSKFALSCKCGKFDINCENIFLISRTHHAVIDPTIWDRITQEPLQNKAYIDVDADLKKHKEWYHTNCRKKMGTVYIYKGVYRLPVLGQERCVYYRKNDHPRIPQPVKKWKLAPFEKSLIEVSEEQLKQMAGVL